MKKFKKIFGFIGICLAFVFFLASCSNVSKDYADKINNAYKKYKEEKENRNGIIW